MCHDRQVETVLITGGAGTLGRATSALLLARGDRVTVLDLVSGEERPGVAWVQGDVRRPDDIRGAMESVDAVVHAAAWHGIHMRDHSPADFWELNVDGTFQVFRAAVDAGIQRVVVASTMGVYGASRALPPGGGAVRLHEGLPVKPVNVYELSKVITEEIAASYDRQEPAGVRSVALRFGMFVPEPFLHSGIRFLYGGVDERDVASAVVAALDVIRTSVPGGFAAYDIFSALPYDESDARSLRSDPDAVIARHWPDAPALMERAGVKPWGPINEWYDISRAREGLGWTPRYGFTEFLAALREGRSSL